MEWKQRHSKLKKTKRNQCAKKTENCFERLEKKKSWCGKRRLTYLYGWNGFPDLPRYLFHLAQTKHSIIQDSQCKTLNKKFFGLFLFKIHSDVKNSVQFRLLCGRPVQGDVIRDRAVDWLKFIPYKHYTVYRGYMNGQLYGGQLYGRSADSSPRIRWLVHGVLWGGRPPWRVLSTIA